MREPDPAPPRLLRDEPLIRARLAWRRFARRLADHMPKGLYGRSLLIVILPMLILQSVVAYVFMERHWRLVTGRLSEALARDVAAVIDVIETWPQDPDWRIVGSIAERDLGFTVTVLPGTTLPPPMPKPFFSLLDSALSEEIGNRIHRPFWIDTVGNSDLVEIRIVMKSGILRVIARRSQAYASNSHIFLVWMVSTSLVLILIAVLFLRNQIRPIQQLADAAESFGKGRPVGDFKPRGAREVRRAGEAFAVMRGRIERQIEQRTAMLAGVSHDLRTVLTRFRLQTALMPEGPDREAMETDVDEMQAMLEAYLAFARGEGNEEATATDIAELLRAIAQDAERAGFEIAHTFAGAPTVVVRPNAFKRLLGNLVGNALRHGERVELRGIHVGDWLTVTVDDDGPGIPEAERDNVFRPFYRLDEARNQDEGGTGLGLAIARDVARGHGGDITLDASPLGGLRAIVRIPG
ncbi:MAG: HAMP domain-containing protein [Phyllobacteriaceae bacterium]|nr:HAMP domain-containing protein [Phyllobacteriaceae bacterium]